jgi:plasmid stability protein
VAQLIVRNLETELVLRLKRRAGEHGRSTEAEHREILRAALLGSRPKGTLKDHLRQMPPFGKDHDLSPRRGKVRGVRL